jgi:hypothetical protein
VVEPTAVEPTAVEPTAGEPTAGEPTAEEPTAGEPTAGEPTAGELAVAAATTGGDQQVRSPRSAEVWLPSSQQCAASGLSSKVDSRLAA